MATPRERRWVPALLLALLVVTSSTSVYFFYRFTVETGANANLTSELAASSTAYSAEESKYNSLVGTYNDVLARYNGSLSSFQQVSEAYNESVAQFEGLSAAFEQLSSGYNSSLSLLVQAVSQLNTSEPAYVTASTALEGLWNQYQEANAQYRQNVVQYQNLTLQFERVVSSFEKQNPGTAFQFAPLPTITPRPLLTYNMLIDFGNGSMMWYNSSAFQPGWNLYDATLVLTGGRIDAVWYPQYGEHFVTGILGVDNNQNSSWFLWSYTSSGWGVTQVGADDIQLVNGSIYAWTFCGMNAQYQPTCVP